MHTECDTFSTIHRHHPGYVHRGNNWQCCNCREAGLQSGEKSTYTKYGCRLCKKRSPEWAVVEKGRLAKATQLDEWLRDACDLDDVEERTQIVLLFMDSRYVVHSTAKLFALDPADLTTILGPIKLGAHRLVTHTWCKWRSELDRGGDPWLQQRHRALKRARIEYVLPE